MDRELASEKVKVDHAVLINRDKAQLQDKLHDSKLKQNLAAKEAERDSLKNRKLSCHTELMATSNYYGFVTILYLAFCSFVSSLSI
jgi:hypothetical protein